MRTPGAQSYAVLTLCRALYSHTHGRQTSKKQAASWARTYLPQWAPLIQQSSLWLSEGQYNEAGDEAGLQETVRFVHDVASRTPVPWKAPPTPRGDTVVRRPPQAGRCPSLPSLSR